MSPIPKKSFYMKKKKFWQNLGSFIKKRKQNEDSQAKKTFKNGGFKIT